LCEQALNHKTYSKKGADTNKQNTHTKTGCNKK